MRTSGEMQILMSIERRLTAIEFRLNGLENCRRYAKRFDLADFLQGPWGKGLLIIALLAAQVPAKDVIMAVFK